MRVEILDCAEADLLAGHQFYEKQGPGLGDYFLHTLYADIDSLHLFGGIHGMVFGRHRLLSRRFPYAVYYETAGDLVQVWAVIDCRRKPSWIKSQIHSRRRPR